MTKVDVDLDRAREILGTETIAETIDAAFRQVIRVAATRDLLALANEGAFRTLLEPDIERRLWD